MTIVLAGGLLAACGDDTGTNGSSIFGTYTLQTIDGVSLPWLNRQVGATVFEITAGSVRLNSDNTYSFSITSTETTAGIVETEVTTGAGTFVATGAGTFVATVFSIQFSDSGDGFGPFSGSITGKTLTIIDEGVAFVFRK